jgi:hypothetical protein
MHMKVVRLLALRAGRLYLRKYSWYSFLSKLLGLSTEHHGLLTPHISDRCFRLLSDHASWNYEDERLAATELVRQCAEMSENNSYRHEWNHTAKYRGCVKGKETNAVLENSAPCELRKGMAHPAALTPKDKKWGVIRHGDPETWLELHRPCC